MLDIERGSELAANKEGPLSDAGQPDLVMLGAHVVTLSGHQSGAQAVAIRNGRILAVGSDTDIQNLVGRSTRVIGCQGKCLLPGFHDAHLHLLACAKKLLSAECGPESVSSIVDIRRALKLRARTLPRGTWILAGDYDEFSLAEGRHLTRWDLDAATLDHPVRLRHRSHHASVLNSLALQLAGVDSSSSLAAGARIEVDPETGEPTGLVYEMEHELGQRVIPPTDEAMLHVALRQVFDALLAMGITAVQDASAYNEPREWELFKTMFERGTPQPRVMLMVGHGHFAGTTEWESNEGLDECVRMGPVKIVLTEGKNDFHPSMPELFEMVWEAHRRGFPVAIHAVEESAVCLATEAIAAAVTRLPRRDVRHRIEHASVVPPALLERMSQAGVAVATQPGFLYRHGDRYLAEVDEHVRGWLYPVRSMIDHGIIVSAGSDAPVAPADPLLGIYAAITRRSRHGQLVNEAEQLSTHQAVVLHTLAPAILAGADEQIGSIMAGKQADLVMLSANPLEVHPEEIPEIKAEMTLVGGKVVWELGAGG